MALRKLERERYEFEAPKDRTPQFTSRPSTISDPAKKLLVQLSPFASTKYSQRVDRCQPSSVGCDSVHECWTMNFPSLPGSSIRMYRKTAILVGNPHVQQVKVNLEYLEGPSEEDLEDLESLNQIRTVLQNTGLEKK